MNDDFPWFLFAMIIIAFLRWVAMKLQGNKGETEIDVRELPEEDYFEEIQDRSEITARTDPTADPNEEIRRFFEAIGGAPEVHADPAPPPPPLPSPPPIPALAEEEIASPPTPVLSETEQAALRRYRAREAEAPSATRHRRDADQSIRPLLRRRGDLKTAIVLREILDRPKGLKEMEDSPTF